MLRILIVDDHPLVRLGLKGLLARRQGWKVVAEARTVTEAIQQTQAQRPDVVIMDIRLGEGSGVDACREIVKTHPDTKVIMLTAFAEDEQLLNAIAAGAVGYVLKQVGNNDLIRVIRAVARGESLLHPEDTNQDLAKLHRDARPEVFADLTEQELKVLALVAQGKTNREVSSTLHLSEGTIRNYVSSILNKLGLANRAEATAYATRHNLDEVVD